MNKIIKVSYPLIPNMGDRLNELIIRNLFGFEIQSSNSIIAELSAIGSGLKAFTLTGGKLSKARKLIIGPFLPPVKIWGTGFIDYSEKDMPFFRKMDFYAVRGKLSLLRVEKLIKRKLDIPLGDGGILAGELINGGGKIYKVGVISHFREQENPLWKKLTDSFDNSVFIDLRKDPMDVISLISSCECIISSALHGLIVADSLGIPNMRIKNTNAPLGDGFKFDDYYSGYGLNSAAVDVNAVDITSLNTVYDNYKITRKMVDEKKELLTKAFPYKK
ncbi:hypothetical protein FACS189490_09100 [Clostridia bacterium]|nr:hypothetical protein FACS189490_09100 [Clostridia bacterium]